MVELTIDGKPVQVPEGSMVMHAANKLGVYIPHFCYHKKLSIAANCRMCLVEVEKAPKALPACATPVTQGMVVHTRSEKAIAAQKAVMEFLLINHPLDCPVCDQGGECQLQDLSVGYGQSASRYQEEKRVVFHKNMGPLISAEAMQRCIHCTRCVRFGQEIAGIMELGMLNRGEFSEITTFVGRAVESELSGNMIDLCPVGALLSKPFRFTARTWELARRRSVSPHDSLGANIIVQVLRDRVMRVVPYENEEVNECWISDRDRFSYEGLNTADRLTAPMIRNADGTWREADWQEALEVVASGLGQVKESFGAGQIGALAAEYSTTEEFALLARLVRALGSDNIDFRLRQLDPAFDSALTGAPWLGMRVSEIADLDRVLVIGGFMRADQPLITQRLRQAAKRGTEVLSIDVAADDWFLPISARYTVRPSALAHAVAEVLVALARIRQTEIPAELAGVQPSEQAEAIARSLSTGSKVAIWLGRAVLESPAATQIALNAQAVANLAGANFGFLPVGGNAVGGYVAGATPQRNGKNAVAMLAAPLKSYVVLNVEPLLDTAQGAGAVEVLRNAQFNVALTTYRSAAEDWAHVMLPVTPFTETSGTFINLAGQVQSFKGTVPPQGAARPAWKVLRVLGNVLHLPGFDEETSEAVRDSVLGALTEKLSNRLEGKLGSGNVSATGVERVADVPIYFSDAIVRRARSLQATPAAAAPRARMNPRTLAQLGVADGDTVLVRGAAGSVRLEACADNSLADGAVRIAAAHASTAALGACVGNIIVERV